VHPPKSAKPNIEVVIIFGCIRKGPVILVMFYMTN